MPRVVRNVIVWSTAIYGLSLLTAFVVGGILFAHPSRVPVSPDALRAAVPASWSMDFLRESRQINIRIADQTHLSATAVGNDGYATVIVVHQSGSNRLSGLTAAYALWSAGFDVILLDRRAQGESDGDSRPLFGAEESDFKAVVDRLISDEWTGTTRIGMFGIGDGGTACLIAAAEDSRIDAVAALDPALSANDFVSRELCGRLRVPSPLLSAQTFLAVKGMSIVSGVSPRQLDASPQLAGLDAPTLVLNTGSEQHKQSALQVFKAIPAGLSEIATLDDIERPDGFETLVDFFRRSF